MAGNSLTCFDLGICFAVVVETTIATYCNGQMIQAQPKAERERILKNQSFCCRFSFVFRIRRFEFDAALTCHALTIEIELNGAQWRLKFRGSGMHTMKQSKERSGRLSLPQWNTRRSLYASHSTPVLMSSGGTATMDLHCHPQPQTRTAIY
jgi:hypothetical protein